MKNAIILTPGNKKNYWEYTWFLLKQLSQFDIPVYALTIDSECKIPDDEIAEWRKVNGNFKICNAQNELDELGLTEKIDDGFSRFTFLKLVSPLVPELREYDRVLWLDTDVIINQDITPLFDIDMENMPMGGAEDYVVMYGHLRHEIQKLHDWAKSHGIEPQNGNSYYNCGVVLMNNVEILKDIEGYKKKIRNVMEIFYSGDKWMFYEQGLINMIFKVKRLPPEYNIEMFFQPRSPNDKILHFLAGTKRYLEEIIRQVKNKLQNV